MVSAPRACAVLGLSAFAAGACKPDLDQTVSIVDQPLVLAVRSDPAEATPTTTVAYTALYVDATGPRTDVPIQWAFCNARKPLAELGPVNTECLSVSGDWFAQVGVGTQVSGAIPSIACRQFGPDVPVPVEGQPPGRPVDPDSTGGYYQPLRLLEPAGGAYSVGIAETRVTCALAGALGDLSARFAQRYHANVNPALLSVTSLSQADGTSPGAGLKTSDEGATNVVAAGTRLSLRAAWAACPTQDTCGDGVCGPDETVKTCAADCPSSVTAGSCSGAERYAAFDLASQEITDRREAMSVAWFATGGSFDADTTGRDSNDVATTSDNGWRAPGATSVVHMWVVLRDDRGGAGWSEYVFDVR